VINDDTAGPNLVGPLHRLAEQAESVRLAELLIGGVLKSELAGFTVNSLRWELMGADDFVLAPLPNHLFQRDNSAWVYGGVSINPMAMPARIRESVHSTAIYRFHPMFAKGEFKPLLDWLRKNIHIRGMTYPARELVKQVTGSDLSFEPLLKHLSRKASELYGV